MLGVWRINSTHTCDGCDGWCSREKYQIFYGLNDWSMFLWVLLHIITVSLFKVFLQSRFRHRTDSTVPRSRVLDVIKREFDENATGGLAARAVARAFGSVVNNRGRKLWVTVTIFNHAILTMKFQVLDYTHQFVAVFGNSKFRETWAKRYSRLLRDAGGLHM